MEADARVAKLGQKARHPPIKGPGPSRRRCACGGSGWSKYQPPLERIHGPRQREPGWDQQGRCCKSRWVIAAGLKLIVVPVDSTWMRRSLANGSRARASHASRARAGRSRQRQSKWAGSARRCTRTALVTAPFLFGTVPAFSARPCGYFRSGYQSSGRRLNASRSRPAIVGACPPSPARRSLSERCAPPAFAVSWSIARTTSAAWCGSSTPHAKIHIGAGASLRGTNNKPGRNHRGRS